MSEDRLVALCRNLINDRASSDDIPFHCREHIDAIADELKERDAATAANKKRANDRRAIGGWAFPTLNARKCHYFPANEDKSLCGSYALFQQNLRPSSPPQTYTESIDDCAACKRKVLAKLTDYYPGGQS